MLGSSYIDGGQVAVNMHFFEAAKRFLVLDKLQQLEVACPVRILHGVQVGNKGAADGAFVHLHSM